MSNTKEWHFSFFPIFYFKCLMRGLYQIIINNHAPSIICLNSRQTSGLVTFASYLFFHLQQSLTNEVIYDGKHIICTSVTFPSFSVQFYEVCSSHHIINEGKCVMFSFLQVHFPHSHCYIISIAFTLSLL